MNKECDSNEKEKKQEKLVAAEAAHCFGKHANEKFPENALAVDSNSRNESESKPCEEKMLVCSGVDTDLNCESQTDCNKTTEEDIHTSDDFKVIEANSKTALSSPRIDIFERYPKMFSSLTAYFRTYLYFLMLWYFMKLQVHAHIMV